MLADECILHIGTNMRHLAGGLMPNRRYAAFGPVDPAIFNIGEVAPADAAGFDLHHHVGITRGGRGFWVEPYIVNAVNIQDTHGRSPR